MKRFRIHYKSCDIYSIDIDAQTLEEAREKASEIDGGQFEEASEADSWVPCPACDTEIDED